METFYGGHYPPPFDGRPPLKPGHGCHKPAPPPPPPHPPACDWPLPEIVLGARKVHRSLRETLTITGLPGCACGPYTLLGLETEGLTPTVRMLPSCQGPSAAVAEVEIPLIACVRDGRGVLHHGQAQLTICCHLPSRCGCAPNAHWLAAAQVRLVHGDTACDRPIFDVCLAVCVEVYWVRVPRRKACECAWPQLPLYPRPCYYDHMGC
ncbi:MAG: hypothetical protein LBN04_12780 [Oscillospiraceae bacterium]|jgi:hypothetical protein|nr:hypothetical protein [Oscillospiraceae bacterium]